MNYLFLIAAISTIIVSLLIIQLLVWLFDSDKYETIDEVIFWWDTLDGLSYCRCIKRKHRFLKYTTKEISGYRPYEHPKMIEYLKIKT